MQPAADVVQVELDRPEAANAIDHRVLDQLEDALFQRDAGAVVLSAAPGRVFSAGGDLRLAPEELTRLSDRVCDLCRRSVSSATVFIVAADGLAVGSGAQLLLAADLRVVGPGARLRVADPDRGLAAGCWSLPGHVGRSRALRMLLLGGDLGAEELVGLGLADGVEQEPAAAASELAARVARLERNYRERVKLTVAAASVPLTALELERMSFVPPPPIREGAPSGD